MPQASDSIWEDLVLSILSVNQYSLEKTYSAVEGLRREGLFEPENLISWSSEEIVAHLKQGGCGRGVFMTTLFGHRLSSLGYFLQSKGVKACEEILRSGDSSAIRELLLPINGVGPRVLQNFFVMRGISGFRKHT